MYFTILSPFNLSLGDIKDPQPITMPPSCRYLWFIVLVFSEQIVDIHTISRKHKSMFHENRIFEIDPFLCQQQLVNCYFCLLRLCTNLCHREKSHFICILFRRHQPGIPWSPFLSYVMLLFPFAVSYNTTLGYRARKAFVATWLWKSCSTCSTLTLQGQLSRIVAWAFGNIMLSSLFIHLASSSFVIMYLTIFCTCTSRRHNAVQSIENAIPYSSFFLCLELNIYKSVCPQNVNTSFNYVL